MNQPDWSTAPEWANFTAMDIDGEWYWFENEPSINEDGFWFSNGGNFAESTYKGMDCRESLTERPKQ